MNNDTPRQNPFVGPRSFHMGETLYGRTKEVDELVDMLIAERIVLLYSASGAGKTSLIRAALIPRLREERFDVLPPIRLNTALPENLHLDNSPEQSPNRYILSMLMSLEEELPANLRLSLEDRLHIPSLNYYLDQRTDVMAMIRMHQKAHDANQPLDTFYDDDETAGEVLIFDQFEEILTVDVTDQPAKEAFFIQLKEALRQRDRWAIFSMREEFVTRLDPYLKYIPTRFKQTYRLELLSQQQAHHAIRQPARAAGVTLQPEVVNRIITDLCHIRTQLPDGNVHTVASSFVEPVHLQVVCRRLWTQIPPDVTTVTVDDIDNIISLGNVDSALVEYYNDSVAAIAARTLTPERAIREWFDKSLITKQDIRGQVLQTADDTQGLPFSIINELIDVHLVRSEHRRGLTWFELSHDRLIAPIRTSNAAWFTVTLSTLQRQAALWEKQGRPDRLLFRDEMLVEAETWEQEHLDELNNSEKNFLSESREEFAIVRRERTNQYYMRLLAISSTIISIIALIAFFVATYYFLHVSEAESIARNTAIVAQSRELSSVALSTIETDPALSTWLALQAHTLLDTIQNTFQHASINDAILQANRFNKTVLYQAMANNHAQRTISGHAFQLYDAVYSPDGTMIATANLQGMVQVWHATTGEELRTIMAHQAEAYSVVFSADGKWLLTAGGDGNVTLWDVETGYEIQTYRHTGKVYFATFSPNEQLVMSVGADGIARVWERETGFLHYVLRGHTDEVYEAYFNNDGTRIATASIDGTAIVWDATTGKQLHTYSHDDAVFSVAFSPDGKTLAVACANSTVYLWDVASETMVHSFSTPDVGYIWSVSYSHDGHYLAYAGENAHVYLYDVTINKGIATFPKKHTRTIWNVSFSPDDSCLVSSSADGTANVWQHDTGENLLTLMQYNATNIMGIAFSPDGTSVATVSNDRTAKIWETSTGKNRGSVYKLDEVLNDVAYSPDGSRVAIAVANGTISIWKTDSVLADIVSSIEAKTVKPDQTLTGHIKSVNKIAYHPDGIHLASASDDLTVRIWDTTTGKTVARLSQHVTPVTYVMYSHNGALLATASADGVINIWDSRTYQVLHTIKKHTKKVRSLSFSYDDAYLASASQDGTALLWDVNNGTKLFTFDKTTVLFMEIAFSPVDYRLAVASIDGKIRVLDATSNRPLYTLSGHRGLVNRIVFNHDGTLLASAGQDGTARLWDVAVGHSGQINSVVYSTDGKHILTASDDNTVRLWNGTATRMQQQLDVEKQCLGAALSPDGTHIATACNDTVAHIYDATTGALVHSLAAHQDVIHHIAYSPDGTMIATASHDHSVIIWDATTGKSNSILRGHSGSVNDVVFSPDGHYIATASDDTLVIVWDVATKHKVHTLFGHTGAVKAVAFSPDGTQLASGGNDTTIRVWNMQQGSILLTLFGHTNAVVALAYSPDGHNLASASWDSTAKLWDVSQNTNNMVQLFNHASMVNDVAFSSDGNHLATVSASSLFVYQLNDDALFTEAQAHSTNNAMIEEEFKRLYGGSQ